MFHLLGLIIGFFIALFALNIFLGLLQGIGGALTGNDPDKRLRDQEAELRRQEYLDDYYD